MPDRWRAAALGISGGVAAAVMAGFGLLDLVMGQPLWAALALLGTGVSLVSVAASRARPEMPAWAPYPLALCVVGLLGVLPHVGGEASGAALMWYCTAPPLLMAILGARIGLGFCAGLFGLLVLALATTEHALAGAVGLSYVAAYLLIVTSVWFYERLRGSASRALSAQTAEIGRLRGLLSVCGWCHKRIRDEDGNWVPIERYLQDRAPVRITHGLCQFCEADMARNLEDERPGDRA
jgi:hypothetical protein